MNIWALVQMMSGLTKTSRDLCSPFESYKEVDPLIYIGNST